ncbi:MAG: helix-turn-helix transcriptional regulator [Pseudomonadota bacterium]
MTGKISPSKKGFQDERYRALIQKLVDQRKALEWSQEDLAGMLGRHQQFVSRYEIGERRLDVVEFIDIARCLKLGGPELMKSIIPIENG